VTIFLMLSGSNEKRVDFASVRDLLPLPRPRVIQYCVTARRVGPRAMATVRALHYQVGIPVRNAPSDGAQEEPTTEGGGKTGQSLSCSYQSESSGLTPNPALFSYQFIYKNRVMLPVVITLSLIARLAWIWS
jgi:hypothetical protein